ncbi:MAG: bifunctional diaminohydroxyphosphoribosylaminopyrimidine deaminase/5-amino-6-(5-phosphoribosylamino)uracil reductase RibD [Lentisphaeria bacterium]|nr:bifunctional diaminohydroxyphosphoribosylaminopyrimidine deaminase/5-amino-6-(5-phosphoribosylamino)uracil reductase RibD [Lentisphaeria bacterium]
MSADSEKWMRIALDEARKGYGFVSPNPLVGAVIVRDGIILGKGYHHQCGMPHAEVEAVRNAEADGYSCEGAEIYVTLEPCCTYGRTPPCTELICSRKFKFVSIGTLDPNPSHAGRALKIFDEHNIKYEVGVLEKECRDLNRIFFKYITAKRPYVLLKMGVTLDGRIACANGCSKFITGAEARQRVQYLRRGFDAIMVGAETVRKDLPTLFARNADGTLFERKMQRIIASKSMTRHELETIYGDVDAVGDFEIVDVSTTEKWDVFLKNLAERKITSLFIEGGSELAASALASGIVDRVEFHIAPKIMGGRDSIGAVGGKSPLDLANLYSLKNVEILKLGDDIGISGDLN